MLTYPSPSNTKNLRTHLCAITERFNVYSAQKVKYRKKLKQPCQSCSL